MVLVESSILLGKPVIAGDSVAPRETLVDGKTGFIIDATKPEPGLLSAVIFHTNCMRQTTINNVCSEQRLGLHVSIFFRLANHWLAGNINI